jgi:spore coat protein CotH
MMTCVPDRSGGQTLDFFDDSLVHELRLHLFPSNWQALKDTFLENTFYAAVMEWDGVRVSEVAIRSRGLGSRSATKPGLRVDFSRYIPGRTLGGVSALALDNSLQDSSFLRERLSMALFTRMGIAAPQESYARVYVNHEYYGLYIVAEEITEAFILRNADSPAGNLYEYQWMTSWDFETLGDDQGDYLELFEPRNNLRQTDRRELVELVRAINAPEGEFLAALDQMVDLRQYLTFVAVEHYLADWDGQAGYDGINNFYIYRSPATGKFSFIPWDKDVTFIELEFSAIELADRNLLLTRLFQQPAILAEYLRILEDVAIAAGGPGGFLESEADRHVSLFLESALEDSLKPVDNDTMLSSIAYTRFFAGERQGIVLNEIARRLIVR